MPELIKEAQTKYAECENELLTNFANKIQQPNMRRAVFQQLYPNARGLWSQPPPTSYAEMKKLLLSSMTSYHNLDNISRIFKPQDWGTAMLNVLLMLAPPEVLDYIVVHELCHRKHLNHSAQFWAEVEMAFPDYRRQEAWLKENGHMLMSRLFD